VPAGTNNTCLVACNAAETANYSVVVSNAAGSVTSSSACVASLAPSIPSQVARKNLDAGSNATISVLCTKWPAPIRGF